MAASSKPLQLANGNLQLLAWHGWRLRIPSDWNPVRVEGDYDQGSVLIADLSQARLGVRWRRAARKGNPGKWARAALRSEVGELAAKEATDVSLPEMTGWNVAKLYVEPAPPGRDVFVAWSNRSDRVIEIVHHLKQRDRFMADELLPTLGDTDPAEPKDWSIFDLSCRTPADWALQWFRLNAGDLTLSFRRQRRTMALRQIGPAKLALDRQTLDEWMGQQDKSLRKLYRPLRETEEVNLRVHGQLVPVRRAYFRRRRRLWWAFTIPARLEVIGLHDWARNRLLVLRGEEEGPLVELLQTVGQVGWD